MNRFKYQAFLQEFPFLQVLFQQRDSKDCKSIQIKRITAELLTLTPSVSEHTGSAVGIHEGDEVWIVSAKDDDLLAMSPITTNYVFGSNWAYTDGYEKPGESLLEALDRYEVIPEFIVWIKFGLETVDHYSTSAWQAMVYKPAKDFDIADLINEAKAQSLAAVQAEAAF